ncbi:MAG TPA: glycosyltransferase [Flavobacterium sp.]|nr:glycosyltransferase [Flavobacterium sp.]
MMKVSVIIPAYNCQDFIQSTINSVINQTYPQELIEVIIVNDGSTDNTTTILNSYKDSFKIIHTENKGVSHARNTGLANATGDFIQYLDADDLLESKKIEIQVQALLANKADVAYGNWERFLEINSKIHVTKKVIRRMQGDPKIALFTDFWCPPAALLYSKKIAKEIGPWKEWLPVIQDARYFLDAALHNAKFIYTDYNVAYYREGNPNSLSKKLTLFALDRYKNTLDIAKIWSHELSFNPDKREALVNNLGAIIPNLRHLPLKKHVHAIKKLLMIDPNFRPITKARHLVSIIGFKNTELLLRYLK